MSTPTVTFSEYARALELGAEIPTSITDLVGSSPTPYQVLQRLVSRAERRERGTYFTSSSTAALLWKDALETVTSGSVVVDPACGAGDLLHPVVEWALAADLEDVTVRASDVDSDFTRIAVSELRKAADPDRVKIEGFHADFLANTSSVEDATHVVLNPPYVPVVVEELWATGHVNAAAQFIVHALQSMKPGARLLAVLPDVLRSGSRYSAWRRRVESLAGINRIQTHDVFDSQADVHVFILDATAGSIVSSVPWNQATTGRTLGDFAEVRVGAVVPHRDPEVGALTRYVTARSLAADTPLHRRFSGRKDRGPLILVNRTSRPGESPRVRARLWTSADEVAVENHLLVVAPKDGTSCEELLAVLTSGPAAMFLDNRIRCRHLTVRALKEIPWQT